SYRDGAPGGRSSAAIGRRRRFLAIHVRTHRNRHARRSGVGGLVRLRRRRERSLERLPGAEAARREEVLWRDGGGDGGRAGSEFLPVERDPHVVPVGGVERPARAAA